MSLDPGAVRVVAVGDELLDGVHPDLNSPWIAAQLAESGRRMVGAEVVGDEEPDIAAAVLRATAAAPLVFVTGGLGPTLDDVTRHGVAHAAGLELEESPAALENVRAWYDRSGREMPDVNRRQALLPRGATLVRNDFGTAPGFRCEIDGSTVVVLPGPPRELHAVWRAEIAAGLAERPADGDAHAVRRLHFQDVPESQFAAEVGDWMARESNPLMGVTVKGGVLSVRIVGRAASAEEAAALAESRAAELRAHFPAQHLADGDEGRVAFLLGRELIDRSLQVTTAESCTGGLVMGEITRVPGISACVREAFVTYSNDAKAERLGVPTELLDAHGAVSEPVARAMATGALEAAGADLALAITGIAGPDGGTVEKPVGLVWFGLARRVGGGALVEAIERRWPPAPRDKIREWATAKGLALLLATARL